MYGVFLSTAVLPLVLSRTPFLFSPVLSHLLSPRMDSNSTFLFLFYFSLMFTQANNRPFRVWNGTTTIIDGTTTTQNATTVIWGPYTWVNPTSTYVFGGATSITGGTTGPPVTTTLTPGPYPQTTSTSDTKVNSKTTTFSSAQPSSSCTSGCGGGCKS
jgi:hypothetical protein